MLTEDEWKSVSMILEKEEPAKKALSLGTMVSKIAMLGGHLGRKHDGLLVRRRSGSGCSG